jgi:hypothetical protein
MNKWAIYTCYCINGWWKQLNQWLFEIITFTDKTCKMIQIEKWFFDFVSRFMKDKKSGIITFRWDIKNYIKQEFVRYDTWCWMPFIFEKKEN